MKAVDIVITIFAAFFSGGLLLGLKWFYAHMTGNQEFREIMIKQTTDQTNKVHNIEKEILTANEKMTEMFAEEFHPLNAKVKRLKNGLNIVEDKSKLKRTNFDDLAFE